MGYIEAFSHWLATTELSKMVTMHAWIWPLAETLHFIGMALLVGTIGLLDLRMLGVARRLPLGPLHDLVPWGVAGFFLNVITGFIFYAGDPFQYFPNPTFWWKMGFIGLAGLNILAFYLFVYEKIADLGPGADCPLAAKVVGGVSLLLWCGVMYFGRMLPFIGGESG
jgi:hypothetical protein